MLITGESGAGEYNLQRMYVFGCREYRFQDININNGGAFIKAFSFQEGGNCEIEMITMVPIKQAIFLILILVPLLEKNFLH